MRNALGISVQVCLSLYESSFGLNVKMYIALRKHAFSNILKILPPKNEKFLIKNSDDLHISAQNIDCGYP